MIVYVDDTIFDINEDIVKTFAERLRKMYRGMDYSNHKPYTMVDVLVAELENPEN